MVLWVYESHIFSWSKLAKLNWSQQNYIDLHQLTIKLLEFMLWACAQDTKKYAPDTHSQKKKPRACVLFTSIWVGLKITHELYTSSTGLNKCFFTMMKLCNEIYMKNFHRNLFQISEKFPFCTRRCWGGRVVITGSWGLELFS